MFDDDPDFMGMIASIPDVLASSEAQLPSLDLLASSAAQLRDIIPVHHQWPQVPPENSPRAFWGAPQLTLSRLSITAGRGSGGPKPRQIHDGLYMGKDVAYRCYSSQHTFKHAECKGGRHSVSKITIYYLLYTKEAALKAQAAAQMDPNGRLPAAAPEGAAVAPTATALHTSVWEDITYSGTRYGDLGGQTLHKRRDAVLHYVEELPEVYTGARKRASSGDRAAPAAQRRALDPLLQLTEAPAAGPSTMPLTSQQPAQSIPVGHHLPLSLAEPLSALLHAQLQQPMPAEQHISLEQLAGSLMAAMQAVGQQQQQQQQQGPAAPVLSSSLLGLLTSSQTQQEPLPQSTPGIPPSSPLPYSQQTPTELGPAPAILPSTSTPALGMAGFGPPLQPQHHHQSPELPHDHMGISFSPSLPAMSGGSIVSVPGMSWDVFAINRSTTPLSFGALSYLAQPIATTATVEDELADSGTSSPNEPPTAQLASPPSEQQQQQEEGGGDFASSSPPRLLTPPEPNASMIKNIVLQGDIRAFVQCLCHLSRVEVLERLRVSDPQGRSLVQLLLTPNWRLDSPYYENNSKNPFELPAHDQGHAQLQMLQKLATHLPKRVWLHLLNMLNNQSHSGALHTAARFAIAHPAPADPTSTASVTVGHAMLSVIVNDSPMEMLLQQSRAQYLAVTEAARCQDVTATIMILSRVVKLLEAVGLGRQQVKVICFKRERFFMDNKGDEFLQKAMEELNIMGPPLEVDGKKGRIHMTKVHALLAEYRVCREAS